MHPVHAYSFECTGVAVIPNALTLEQVETAKSLIRGNWPGGVPWKFPVLHLGRVFWEMMTHPDLLHLARQFVGEQFRMDHAFGLSSNGAIPQLHGGPQSNQYACFYSQTSGRESRVLAGRVNFGFCLSGQSPETGGFCYVPGSHKQADPRAGREIFAQVYGHKFDHHSLVVPTLIPGDMLMFTEGLIHGDTGWRNQTPGSGRMQVYYMLTPGFACWRDPTQNDHLLAHAQTDLERRLLAPPWVGRYEETETVMGVNNSLRAPTIQS
jgi:hypothetical protein